MNRLVFALVAWLFLGLEVGLKDTLKIGTSAVAPSFVAVLATFVSLWAPHRTALWACLVLGLAVDLTNVVPLRNGAVATLVGPYAVGFTLLGQLVITMRGLMVRRNPLALGFLSALGVAVSYAVVVAILTIHSIFGDPIVWSATDRLAASLGSALYTGLLAVLLGLVLPSIAPLMGLATAPRGGWAPRRNY